MKKYTKIRVFIVVNQKNFKIGENTPKIEFLIVVNQKNLKWEKIKK